MGISPFDSCKHLMHLCVHQADVSHSSNVALQIDGHSMFLVVGGGHRDPASAAGSKTAYGHEIWYAVWNEMRARLGGVPLWPSEHS